jgi:hypothetical protein
MISALCSNCNAPLTGPYCAQCGQHAHASARTLGALLHEAWHLTTHLDTRLWSTLFTLMARPGVLTREYFAGHRARFMPPFQLYFVISLAFFGLTSLSAHLHPQHSRMDVDAALNVRLENSDCARIDTGASRLDDALRSACIRQAADHGQSLERVFRAAIPKMMFLFLPLMAGATMLLYLRQRHFYVEHLVMFLHAHAALYVAIVPELVIDIVSRYVVALRGFSDLVDLIVTLYSFAYVYIAMRRFYSQGWAITGTKFLVIVLAYGVSLVLTMLGTLIVSALVT